MTDKHVRWQTVHGRTVIFVNAADRVVTQARFDKSVAEGIASGAVNKGNHPWALEALWSRAHYGADVVQWAPDGVEIEPLTTWADGRPLSEVEPEAEAVAGEAATERK